MPSTHENAINGLFATYLHQHGLDVRVGATVVDSDGTTRWPDFELSNSGLFFGEGEFEDTAWVGFGQARDYSMAVGSSGAFLILYPRALRRLPPGASLSRIQPESILSAHRYDLAFIKPGRTTDGRPGVRLEDIPHWLDERIHETTPPQVNVSQSIKILRQAVDALTAFLPETVTDTNLFENLLGREPSQGAAIKATRQAAAYILVNQLMYYQVLVRENPHTLAPLVPSKVGTPSDLTRLFPQDSKHKAVFGLDVASQFKPSATETVRQIVKVVEALSPGHVGGASLGKLFHELIPLDIRKHIAAFYTLEEAAKLLAGLVVKSASARVFDPACGSGTLLVAAYRRKKELDERAPSIPGQVHGVFLEKDLTGVDMMPFAAHMSALNLVLQAPDMEAPATRIAIGDSTVLSPGDSLAPIQQVLPRSRIQRGLDDFQTGSAVPQRKVHAGRIGFGRSGGGTPLKLDAVDCVLMNPPFTRFQRLASFYAGYPKNVATSFREYRKYINGRMPYCNYFLFLADRFLEHGRAPPGSPVIGAVLPATVLRGDSSEGVRKFLLERYSIPYVIRRRRAANFSEDTQFTEILLILGEKRAVSAPTSFVILDELEGTMYDEIETSEVRPASRANENAGSVEVRKVRLDELGTSNWFKPFSLSEGRLQSVWESWEREALSSTLSQIATDLQSKDQSESGGPTFPSFSLNQGTEDEVRGDKWVIEGGQRVLQARNVENGETRSFPIGSVLPLFRRFRHRGVMDVSSLSEFIPSNSLGIPPDFPSLSRVRGRVRWADWHSYLLSRRSNLMLVDRLDITAPGTCLVSYFSSPPRVWARVGTVIKGLSDDQARTLTLWFNSTPGLLGYLAEQIPTRGGYMQLGKYVYSDFRVPNVRALDTKMLQHASSVFSKVASVEFPRLMSQFAWLASGSCLSDHTLKGAESALGISADKWPTGFQPRQEIDEIAFDLLGLGPEERSDLKGWLYSSVLAELVTLWDIIQQGGDGEEPTPEAG